MTTYILSNAQTKELQRRGRPVILALPMPPERPRGLYRWALKSLAAGLGKYVQGMEEGEVIVGTSPSPEGVTGAIGAIQREWSDEHLCWRVPVILVRLEPEVVRGPVLGPQWPGDWVNE